MNGETRGAPLALAVLVCLSVLVVPIGAATVAPHDRPGVDRPGDPQRSVAARGAADAPGDPLHTEVETDRIRLIAAVQDDGDAEWTIEYRTNLDDENTTEAFRTLKEDIEANPDNYTDRFAERIRSTVRAAENATGRPMTASGFSVDARETISSDGVIAYTFTWSNFSQPQGDRIVVGDALEGLFLDDKTRLEFRWPEGWVRTEVSPDPDRTSGRSVVWVGSSTDFGPEQPRIVVERGTPTSTATATETSTPGPGTATETPDPGTVTETPGPGTATATGTTGPTPTAGDGGGPTATTDTTPANASDGGATGGGGGFAMAAVAVLALLVLGVAVAWLRRPTDVDAAETDDSTTADATEASPGAPEPPAETDEGAVHDDGTGDEKDSGDPDGGETDEGDEGEPAIDEELLSNEERVLRLLERRGGRIKQQEVVDALDWTEAKTSQVVSGMREEGSIDGFRLGRENVLTLPDEEIDPTDEPGGDESGT